VLAFSEWLAPEDAQNLERDAFRLRQEGHSFSTTLRTLRGERVEIEGRPVAGRAVMVMRQLRGESLQIATLQDERRAIDRMFSQMRGMLDAIPQPAWLRDAAGRLLWMNAAYARAVDARNEAEVLERQVELLDSADRAAIREETERCGQFRGAQARGFDAVARLDDGNWVDLRQFDPANLAAAGWVAVVETDRPDDTDTHTWASSVELVAGVPTRTWTQVDKPPQAPPSADDRLAAVAAAVAEAAEVETIADMEALREALAAALGGQ
jgi:PAS domain-containing protein